MSRDLEIVARAESDAEAEPLTHVGASVVLTGHREMARGMIDRATGA